MVQVEWTNLNGRREKIFDKNLLLRIWISEIDVGFIGKNSGIVEQLLVGWMAGCKKFHMQNSLLAVVDHYC